MGVGDFAPHLARVLPSHRPPGGQKALLDWTAKPRSHEEGITRSTTLLYPHPVLIVGTYSSDGQPDAMVAAWGGICSSQPPAVAVSIQKIRQTYKNLVEQRDFTISIPSVDHVKEADYFVSSQARRRRSLPLPG
jgi:flavin reductase (DIM6/NTAB) family NADH-FMN oxidoreductase RutF